MSLTRIDKAMNFGAFNRIVCTAAAAGILAGLFLTGVQKIQVSPIILQAEVYEEAAATAHTQAAADEHEHGQQDQESHEYEHEHEHSHDAWQPENGAERTFFTALANISMAVGFGLLLAGAVCLRGNPGWRAGLLWGAAGYAVFFVAPSLGLPPEVPGTAAAPLAARQLWWLTTVVATAGGLSLLVFPRAWALKLVGAAVLCLPHLAGAPQALVQASAAPAELARAFIYATAFANAAFWLALGGLSGYFYKKFA
ncbi:cobalt transporter subunit CbtA [Oxalobacteraceae bacterium GrIS 1.11]